MNTLTLSTATVLFAAAAVSLAQPVRFAHMAQGTPSVDVYLDGQALTGNAGYSTVTPYTQAAGGNHTLKVTASGQPGTVLFQGPVTLAGDATTLAAWNDGHGLRLSAFADRMNTGADPRLPRVRAYNLSPQSGFVNVSEVDGPSLAGGLAQGTASAQAVMGQNLRTFRFSPASDDGGTPLRGHLTDSAPAWTGAGQAVSLFLTSNAVGEEQVVVAQDRPQ